MSNAGIPRIPIGSLPTGPSNGITDVPGVRVGHATILKGTGATIVGEGPVRTGVTVIEPRTVHPYDKPAFAGFHRLNGNGEMTGVHWIAETGLLTSPIALTNTHSLGVVRDALIADWAERTGSRGDQWMLPVVGETWDGILNDINGQHVTAEHVKEALATASDGPVTQGNVGGGTGMICHEFKGGIGTSSRVVSTGAGEFTVGVLVQANHGRRERLTINGARIGEALGASVVPVPLAQAGSDRGGGSIIAVVATDAPLLPQQCTRLAQRVTLGIGRTGGTGEHSSGDLFLAFSTANLGIPPDYQGHEATTFSCEVLHNSQITPLFDAVVEATEEAIVNALIHAKTMEGRDGVTAYGLDPAKVESLLR